MKDLKERYEDRPLKHLMVCHAERNALDLCSIRPHGCTLYCTHIPCNECAKSIIQCGIIRVVIDKESVLPSGWDTVTPIAQIMFQEAGVKVSRM